jgi:hypothetical protein
MASALLFFLLLGLDEIGAAAVALLNLLASRYVRPSPAALAHDAFVSVRTLSCS